MENRGQAGSLNHLGVEDLGTDAVEAEQAGLASVAERDTTCCYAQRYKFWVQGTPDGKRWEICIVLEDSPTCRGQDGSRSWNAAEATLDAGQTSPAQTALCCGGNEG